jgi:hypothetical protein
MPFRHARDAGLHQGSVARMARSHETQQDS